MNPLNPSAGQPSARTPILMHGLSALQHAQQTAAGMRLDPWEFAVRLSALTSVGLTETDVRCLLARGLAEHGEEVIHPKALRRTFRPVANLALTERTCLVLTAAGDRLLESSGDRDLAEGVDQPIVKLTPRWDGELRKLWYGGRVVKWFHVPATCQETLLAAFEEDHWARRIDDPLPRVPGIDPRERLHEAVRRLNGGQLIRLLTFSRDGTGTGVIWTPNNR